MSFLKKIISDKEEFLKNKKFDFSILTNPKKVPSFLLAINKQYKISLIAEIKKASPSLGIIRENFNVSEIAEIYKNNGASALSVLTEEKYFMGKLDYLTEASKITKLPIIRKDFIIDQREIKEARAAGASAILLIVACLEKSKLTDFISTSYGLGLDPLVEVHDNLELEIALASGAKIIGINNRNLSTFKVDLNTSYNMKKNIPKNVTVVSESGIKTREDVIKMHKTGINALLIGEAFMKENDIAKKMKELFNDDKD